MIVTPGRRLAAAREAGSGRRTPGSWIGWVPHRRSIAMASADLGHDPPPLPN